MELTIRSLLISPSFLFRSELGRDNGQGSFTLTPYETASALSYLFWGTMPDAPLFAAAASGALANKSEIEAQARRLLADPRGRSEIAHFFYEWLESPRAYVATKDQAAFPKLFTSSSSLDTIRAAMREEQDQFVTHVVFDSTKRFDELFNATYTFANADWRRITACPIRASPRPRKRWIWARVRRVAGCDVGHVLVRPCPDDGVVTHAARSHDPRQLAV